MGIRDRACALVLNDRSQVLMVHHVHGGRDYWTFPGGGLEDRETFAEAAAREVLEETGLRATIQRPLFDETYDHHGEVSLSRCFLGTVSDTNIVLGVDPEEAERPREEQMLRGVAWRALAEAQRDPLVQRALDSMTRPIPGPPSRYFRVHTRDLAYATQQPRGLFVAVGKLVDGGTLSETEVADYWTNRQWFEAALPVPPFYAVGNPQGAVTWFKNTEAGVSLCERLGFYRRMAFRYGVELFRTDSVEAPGTIVYEDDYQIAVVGPPRREGLVTLPVV